MVVWLPSEGGKPSAWGPVTALTNFCEEDYHVTSYIAEFINTLSNASYIYFGIWGLSNNWHRKPFVDYNLQYFALIFVGVGSGVFHMALKHAGQSADQISMFLGAAAVLHRVATFDAYLPRLPIAILLIVTLLGIFWAQLTLANPVIHWVAFAGMLAIVWRRSAYLIKTSRAAPSEIAKAQRLALYGFGAFAVGFGLWVIDVRQCEELRDFRHTIGLPLAWIFELHGWWHFFTAIGAYLYMVLADFLHIASVSGKARFKRVSLLTVLAVDSEEKQA